MSRPTVRAEASVIEREERTGYPIRIKIVPFEEQPNMVVYRSTGSVTAWYDKAEEIFKYFPHLAKMLKNSSSATFDFFSYNSNIAIVAKEDATWLRRLQ